MEINQTGHCCACKLQFRCPVCYPDDIELYRARPSLARKLKQREAAPEDIMDLVDAVLNPGTVQVTPIDRLGEPGRVLWSTPLYAVRALIVHYKERDARAGLEHSETRRKLTDLKERIAALFSHDDWRALVPEAFDDE